MSRKAYMKKWRNLDDDEADEELRQIALERQILEDSFVEPIPEESEPEDIPEESETEVSNTTETGEEV